MLGNCQADPQKKRKKKNLRLFVGNAHAFCWHWKVCRSSRKRFRFGNFTISGICLPFKLASQLWKKMAYFLARQNLAHKKVLNFRCNVRKCSHSVLAMFAYFNVNICTLTWLLDSRASQAVRQSLLPSLFTISLSLSPSANANLLGMQINMNPAAAAQVSLFAPLLHCFI